MFNFAEKIANNFVKVPMNSSIGKVKKIDTTDQIGFEKPVITSIIEIFILLLVLLGVVILFIAIAPFLVEIGFSSNLVGNIIVTTLSTSLIGAVSMIHYILNKTEHKVIIVKYQLYLYIDGSYGTMETTALSNVKAHIEDNVLKVLMSGRFVFWLDLKTVEDEVWKTEFLHFFGLALN